MLYFSIHLPTRRHPEFISGSILDAETSSA